MDGWNGFLAQPTLPTLAEHPAHDWMARSRAMSVDARSGHVIPTGR